MMPQNEKQSEDSKSIFIILLQITEFSQSFVPDTGHVILTNKIVMPIFVWDLNYDLKSKYCELRIE